MLAQESPNPWINLKPIEVQKKALSFSIYTNRPKPIEDIIIKMCPIIMKFFLPTFCKVILIKGDETSIPTSIIAKTVPTMVSVIVG